MPEATIQEKKANITNTAKQIEVIEGNHYHEVIIIGSGPAGYSAAIYCARANLKPILISGSTPGGQLTITTEVENYPGYTTIQGPQLMINMEEQSKYCGNTHLDDVVTQISKTDNGFKITTENNQVLYSKTAIIATGASAKWLNIPSEKAFLGYGVSGCATCDGFFFKNKIVAVVGGGNSAVEEALYLTKHAAKVYLIHRGGKLRAEKIGQDRLFRNEKIEVIWNKSIHEIYGEVEPFRLVKGVKLIDNISGEISDLSLNGVFIAIGHQPNTSLFKELIQLDSEGYISTKPGTTKTEVNGLFACGDVQDKIYRQAVTAAGTGCMAALDAQKYLETLE